MRNLAYPRTRLQSSELIKRYQDNFSGALNIDDPASELGESEFCGLDNIIAYQKFAEGRRGCRKMSDIPLPIVEFPRTSFARDTFLVRKIGTKVYVSTAPSTIGSPHISELQVGSYIVWSDGFNDQVTAIHAPDGPGLDPYFISRKSETRAEELCPSREKIWGAGWNKNKKYAIVHIGTRLFYISHDFAAYTEITNISSASRKIQASRSKFSHEDDSSVVFNAGGIYRIYWDSTGAYYYPINAAQPTEKITEVPKSPINKFGRRVIYTASRITGDHRGDRVTSGNILQHETAPVYKFQGFQQDASDVYSDYRPGLGLETYGYGASSAAVSTTPSDYNYSNAAFNVNINGEGEQTIAIDLADPVSMQDIALRIQTALQGIFVGATFEFKIISGVASFVMTSGLVDGGTIEDYGAPPGAFTDITPLLKLVFSNTWTWTRPVKYAGISIPTENEQDTHISVWGSNDIGDEGILAGNQPDYLVWLMDVPRVRVFKYAKDSMFAFITSQTTSKFKRYDEGASVRFGSDHSATITYLSTGIAPVNAEDSADAAFSSIPAGVDASGVCCIGADNCAVADQTGNTVTIDGSTAFLFTESHVGNQLFFEDGTSTFILKYVSGTEVEVRDSATKTSIACAWGMTGNRTVSDYITEKTWKNRRDINFYVLQTRYYLPLPSSCIGELFPGFISIFEANSNKHKYTEIPAARKHQAGYYFPGQQEDDSVDDIVTVLKRYSDRIVAFGKKSTWYLLSSAVNTIQEVRTGYSGSVLSRFQQLDNRGIVHTRSIQDVDIGTSVVITNDTSVCLFDGNKFAETNIADGRVAGHVGKLDNDLATSYDNYGGYIIYGTKKMQSDTFNKLNPEDGFCLRLAVKSIQGSLWSTMSGPEMVWPEPLVGGIQIEDGRDYGRQVTIDESTGLWYEISPYEGPEESGLTECWTDKNDTEIIPSILLPEHKGTNETALMEFLEAHCFLRKIPNNEFRTGFLLEAFIYKDGISTPIANTKEIKEEGEIVFDRKASAKRLQLGLSFSTSCFRIVSINEFYNQLDKDNATSPENLQTTYQEYQQDLTSSLLWITRGQEPLLNRAIGNVSVATGTMDYVSGPDLIADSAMNFDGSQKVEADLLADIDGDFTIQFEFKIDPAASIPSVPTSEIATLDGTEFEAMDIIGNSNTFIALDRTNGRFVFVCNMVTAGYLNDANGWVTSEPAGVEAESMGVYFDQDRSCFLFLIDGTVVGVIDGNVLTGNYRTTFPASYQPDVFATINCNIEDERIEFITQTFTGTEPGIKCYIDATGFKVGAPA